MIEAVIFDMDGVLVDSEKYILEAALCFFAQQGVHAKPEDFLPFVGAGEDRYLGGPAAQYGLKLNIKQAKDRTYEIYGQIVHGKLTPLAGARQFIDACRCQGLKLAVATSADLVKLDINLREIGIPRETFDALVNGGDVTHKKPDPEIFLKAAGEIGVDPTRCLVVEDAVNGVKAGKSAGCRCLGLTTSFSAKQLADAGADWTAPSLAGAPAEAVGW